MSDPRRDHILSYLDTDNLMGNDQNPKTVRTGGNELLQTWTAWIIMHKLGILEPQDIETISRATKSCEVPGEVGIYDRNPPLVDGSRRMDEIAHDDICGISMGSSCLSLGFGKDIVKHGKHNWWVFSNTGKLYFTAIAKPWHRAAYTLAAWEKPGDERPGSISLALLAITIVSNAIFGKDNASGKLLIWVTIQGLKGKSYTIDLVSKFWFKQINKTYGSVREIFKRYHNENHPFALYAPEE